MVLTQGRPYWTTLNSVIILYYNFLNVWKWLISGGGDIDIAVVIMSQPNSYHESKAQRLRQNLQHQAALYNTVRKLVTYAVNFAFGVCYYSQRRCSCSCGGPHAHTCSQIRLLLRCCCYICLFEVVSFCIRAVGTFINALKSISGFTDVLDLVMILKG